ncbi:phosphatidylinositide phosphatase SAC2-like [Watersipora subatra]|uniref:phosphatidylinositide phosphatase SAC2-like n=1 Tax=Watersipora subatra TaxID=2589382 RepID=UPI00355AE455
MELYETLENYIIKHGDHTLWCDRKTGEIRPKSGMELCNAVNPTCLGVIHGIIGKVKVLPDSDWRLLLIKQQQHVGQTVNKADVYKIEKVALLPLSDKSLPPDFELSKCDKHPSGSGAVKPRQISQHGKKMLQSTLNSFQKVKDSVQSKKNGKDPQKEWDRLERKIMEELSKMFNISDFYYYSPNGDITSSVQRQNLPSYHTDAPLWKRADERFFWNKALLEDLIVSNDPLADHWIQPIIQGFFERKTCSVSESRFYQQTGLDSHFEFSLTLLSRRSRHRAGTRYKRRGLDPDGSCANYVETEQIIGFQTHTVSYVQVRGSIPVFWSQPGHKYRPPPIIDKDEEEIAVAFDKHFKEQLNHYKDVTCVNLVERSGREKIMAKVFLRHVLLYNNPSVSYVAFDFHEYCRGMQFDNVSMLTESIKDFIKDHKYCWVDGQGMICEQNGVFRVNCIDCLDRTNVVQTAVARIIIDLQVRKLGLLTPDDQLQEGVRHAFNQLWANNGDAISRQYAGTAALKGDYTRTGERKFSGLMRDGVKSANRYLIHRFKDLYRQAAIDIQLGKPLDEDILTLLVREQQPEQQQQEEIDYIRDKASDVVSVIQEARKLMIMEPERSLGGWAVISVDDKDANSMMDTEMDTILLLTDSFYYVVSYDDELDCLSEYQQVPLTDLYAIDVGPYSTSVFKTKFLCMRLWYKYYGDPGYFHTLRVPNVRAFNNTIIEINSPDEQTEMLRAIADSLKVASEYATGLVNIRSIRVESKTFRPVAKRSVQTNTMSMDQTLWHQPHKIASMASSVVNRAARTVSKQLKKINLSPKASNNRAHVGTPNFMEEGDVFDEETCIDEASDHNMVTVDSLLSTEDIHAPAKTMTVGSLPDLSISEVPLVADSTMLSVKTPEDLRHSAPQIWFGEENSLQTGRQDFPSQVHHPTAPNLQELTVQEHDGKVRTFNKPGIDRSALSRIRHGLNQVSQLISNPNSSPQTRRRQQALEAKLLANIQESVLRFSNLDMKILIL